MKRCKIDNLGRIVIPIRYRKDLGLIENSEVTIELEAGEIVIRPSVSVCKLCRNNNCENKEIQLCNLCIEKVKSIK